MGSVTLEQIGDRVQIERVGGFDSLRERWPRLAEANGNVFSTLEWNELWWRHFGQGRELAITVLADRDGEVVGILPLYVYAERPLRIIRFLGHGQADCLGPILDTEQMTASEALRNVLADERYDLFVGDHMPGNAGFRATLDASVLRDTGYGILRFEEPSWEAFVASRGTGFRDRVGKRLRKLEREHGARFRRTDGSTFEADLETTFSLHRERFGDHDGCFFCGPENEGFQREFAAVALERGWLRLWIFELDDRPVAVEYGFRFGPAQFSYQCGRDPEQERHSVGSHVVARALQGALDEGVTEFRFLRGDEPYKHRFATEDPRLQTIASAHSRRGSAALASFNALQRVPVLADLARRLAR